MTPFVLLLLPLFKEREKEQRKTTKYKTNKGSVCKGKELVTEVGKVLCSEQDWLPHTSC